MLYVNQVSKFYNLLWNSYEHEFSRFISLVQKVCSQSLIKEINSCLMYWRIVSYFTSLMFMILLWKSYFSEKIFSNNFLKYTLSYSKWIELQTVWYQYQWRKLDKVTILFSSYCVFVTFLFFSSYFQINMWKEKNNT